MMDLAQAMADNFSDEEITKMFLSVVLAEVMTFVKFSDPWIGNWRCYYCHNAPDRGHKNNCIWETVQGLDGLLPHSAPNGD